MLVKQMPNLLKVQSWNVNTSRYWPKHFASHSWLSFSLGPKHSCFKVFINFPLGPKHSCFKVFINFSLGPKHSCFKVFINMLQGQIQMQTLSNSGPNKLWKLHLYPFKFKSISAANFFNWSLHFLWLGTVWSQQQTLALVLHKFHNGNADFYFCGLLVQFDTNTFHCLYQGFVCVLFQFGML